MDEIVHLPGPLVKSCGQKSAIKMAFTADAALDPIGRSIGAPKPLASAGQGEMITLRQGVRLLEDSHKTRLA
jgi:hypothetical protein